MIDLEIPFSMIVAGPSGCGKSTLIERLVGEFIGRGTFKNIHWYNNDIGAMSEELQSTHLVEVHTEIPQTFDQLKMIH